MARLLLAGALVAALSATPAARVAAPGDQRFLDNGDGTVTDTQTGLMWEKKTDSNVNGTYTESATGTAADGTLFTDFLATMRCAVRVDGRCGFAGYSDWRLPTVDWATG